MNKTKEKKNTEKYVKLYVPELLQIIESGDEKTCLIMAQLEYWFGIKPDGFYKFMTVPEGDTSAYRDGDSWTEEMGMSKSKIGNALKPICTHYQSRTAYKNEQDIFKGKFYCSYYHKPSHMTFYLRNHGEVNRALESLSLESKSPIFREKHSSAFAEKENDLSGQTETEVSDVIEGEVIYTENTPENTSKITQKREENLSPVTDVINKKNSFPSNFEITSEMKEWAKAKRPDIDVEKSTDKFRVFNYEKFAANWLTSWQLWILNEKDTVGETNEFKSRSQKELELYQGVWTRYDDCAD